MKISDKFENSFRKFVLPLLREHLSDEYLSEPIFYYFHIGIIRKFRSGLPIIFADYESLDSRAALVIGAFSELVFCSALILDDFLDSDSLREEADSAHEKYGLKRAIASATYGFSAASALASELLTSFQISSAGCKAHSLLTNSYFDCVRSFGIDLENQGRISPPDDLLNLAAQKTNTGAYALASLGPYSEASGFPGATDLLLQYGTKLGIAAQLRNDVYDFTLYVKRRKRRSDIENGYDSYPLSIMRQSGITMETVTQMTDKQLFVAFEECGAKELLASETEQNVSTAISLVNSMNICDSTKEMLTAWADQHRPRDFCKRGY